MLILTGSGSSIHAGILGVDQITRELETGTNYFFHNDQFLNQTGWNFKPQFKDEHTPVAIDTFKWALEEARKDLPNANYEDAIFLMRLGWDLKGRVPGWELHSLSFEEHLLLPNTPPFYSTFPHQRLAATIKYCNYVVQDKLSIAPKETDYLKFIIDGITDGRVKCISSLNHDMVLETLLDRNKVEYSDGFRLDPELKMLAWSREELFTKGKLKLIKQHGSVSNSYFQAHTGTGSDGIRHIWILKSPLGRWENKIEGAGYHGPHYLGNDLIMGTYSKLVDYTFYNAYHLQQAFYQNLIETNDLLVVGYGFRDFGVNQVILSWAQTNHRHRLILIHPNPQTKLIDERVGLEREWFKWEEVNGTIIQKQVEDVTWSDVENALIVSPQPFRNLLRPHFAGTSTIHHIS